jgi:hypothetical protein
LVKILSKVTVDLGFQIGVRSLIEQEGLVKQSDLIIDLGDVFEFISIDAISLLRRRLPERVFLRVEQVYFKEF